MSEYASRDRSYESSYAPVSAHANAPAPRTPAEQARDEITHAARGVDAIAGSIENVRQAYAANDPVRWREVRGIVDRSIATAQKELERARARAHDAEPDARDQLTRAEALLTQQVAVAAELDEAPRGWKPVAREAEILAILQAPASGPARSEYAQKEEMLKAELAQLSPAESQQLAARVNKHIKDDPIAQAIARFVPERKTRLLQFLGGARKRAALAAVKSPATARPVESSAYESSSFDAQVLHMIDVGAPDPDTFGSIDGTRRRAMARRLEGYRPGSGDALGARFVRLDLSLIHI